MGDRELKFRAWDKHEECMRDWDNLLSHRYSDNFPDENTIFTDKGLLLLQYTGLKDKNGQEIYEGDGFKINEVIGTVIWDESYLRWSVLFREISDKLPLTAFAQSHNKDNLEVIGNIHQNPELLEAHNG